MVNEPSHWFWNGTPKQPTECVIVDIDGVLANASTRQHHLDPPWRDWDAFFADCIDDESFEEIVTLIDLLDPKLAVVLLTSRPMWVQRPTLQWLAKFDISFDLLIMRPLGDFQASPGFKKDETKYLSASGFLPRLAIEDDMRNVRMYRSIEVPTIFLESGYHPH